jgi:hypothetical protein
MTRIEQLDRFQTTLKNLFKNKNNEFVVYSKNKLHMKVHIYPYILEKKIQNNKTEYSMKFY